jgi:two-component system sensor kinase FixL
MSDRRKLLVLLFLIVGAVALAGVGITLYQAHLAMAKHTGPSLSDPSVMWPTLLIAAGNTLIVVVAGGTLLVRVANPFIHRLEVNEARTRAIVETVVDGIITVNELGGIESFNPAAEQLFGYRAQEMIGRNIHFLLPAPLQDADTDEPENLLKAAAVAEATVHFQAFGRRNGGGIVPLELSASGMRLGDRRSLTVIVRDITERKLAEQQTQRHVTALEQAQQHLEAKATELARINRELDDFTYIASHDLKEPLRGISSYCHILVEDYSERLDDEGRGRLEAMVNLCDRLGRLIDDLLTYSQIGRQRPEGTTVEVSAVVEDVLETMGPTLHSRGAIVRTMSELPPAFADPTMLGELLRNLISNAIKFNASERPVVEIGALQDEPPTYFVRDNGIGIAAEHHEDVFAMFRRLHSRRRYDGTGAGLTIVRKIAEAHGGRAWVESEPGCGSTFYFTLEPGYRRAESSLAASAGDRR